MIRARARLQPGVWDDHSLHVDFRTHRGRQLIRLSIGVPLPRQRRHRVGAPRRRVAVGGATARRLHCPARRVRPLHPNRGITMTRSRTEYRVVHELGRQYAEPMVFQDKDDALNVVEGQRRMAKAFGQADLADGWHLEERTITEWQKDTDWKKDTK